VPSAEGLHGGAVFLVNCAGIGPPRRKVVDRGWRGAALGELCKRGECDLLGIQRCCRNSSPLHKAGTHRRRAWLIINTASGRAFRRADRGRAAYARVQGRGCRNDFCPLPANWPALWHPRDAIAPGLFLTPLLAVLWPQEAQGFSLGAQVPFPGPLGRPVESPKWSGHHR